MSDADRPNWLVFAWGGVAGALAWTAGAAVTYVAVLLFLEAPGRFSLPTDPASVVEIVLGGFGDPRGTLLPLLGGTPFESSGLLLFNAHFVRTGVQLADVSRSVDFVDGLGGAWTGLYLLPPVVLTVAGAALARRTAPRGTAGAATTGAAVVVGYLPMAVLGTRLYAVTVRASALSQFTLSASVAPEFAAGVVLAGVVYPVAFGALGGILGARTRGGPVEGSRGESDGSGDAPGGTGPDPGESPPTDGEAGGTDRGRAGSTRDGPSVLSRLRSSGSGGWLPAVAAGGAAWVVGYVAAVCFAVVLGGFGDTSAPGEGTGGLPVVEVAGPSGPEALWKGGGLLFYSAQFVPTEVGIAVSGSGSFEAVEGSLSFAVGLVPDLVPTQGGEWLLLLAVPPAVLAGAGWLLVGRVGAGPDEAVGVGASVVVGYLPLSVLGLFLFEITYTTTVPGGASASVTLGAGTVVGVVLAGVVYPLAFGATGGYLRARRRSDRASRRSGSTRGRSR